MKVNGTYGPRVTCPSSVPQGSVLGAFLFAIFMGSLKLSDAFNELDYVLILFFADEILLSERIVDKIDYHRSATNCV